MMSDKLRAAAQAVGDAKDILFLRDISVHDKVYLKLEDAINAIKAALAEPAIKESLTVAEPIAWLVTYGNFTHVEYTKPNMVVDTYYQPLYTSPLAEQKPMLEMNPEKREWVGLTDEEVTEIRLKMFDVVATNYEAYRAIEAKLREKNT
jgi:hypothetical protein